MENDQYINIATFSFFNRMLSKAASALQGETMGKTAKNEQKKLQATAYNSLGVGIILAGFYIPIFGIYLGGFKTIGPVVTLLLGGTAIAIGFLFHKAGVNALKDLED